MSPRERHLLNSYGLTLDEYEAISKAQGGVCAVCGRPPKTRSLHVDHEHVKGYNKLPPSERRKYIRGLLCFTCNWIFLSRGISLEKARKMVCYLENYDRNKANR
jgi:hypothetical protein